MSRRRWFGRRTFRAADRVDAMQAAKKLLQDTFGHVTVEQYPSLECTRPGCEATAGIGLVATSKLIWEIRGSAVTTCSGARK